MSYVYIIDGFFSLVAKINVDVCRGCTGLGASDNENVHYFGECKLNFQENGRMGHF